MPEHTPGPWDFDVDGDGCPTSIFAPNDPVFYEYHRHVVIGIDDWDDGERVLADVRLMAAAPDLLAACESVRQLFVSEKDPDVEAAREAYVVVSAAIAKAKGETLEEGWTDRGEKGGEW